MSKKDFDKYYEQVQNQYLQMLSYLKEFSAVASTEMVAPEAMENTKKLIEPLKQNYMTLSYIAYLLNTPNRACRIDKFKKQNKKLLEKCGNRTGDDVFEENSNILDEMGKKIK